MTTPVTNPLFEVVLFEPEIPNNTGNIGRTCLAMGSSLHLIEPLGFDLSEKAVRRAGLDYWPRLSPKVHKNWQTYDTHAPEASRWFLTTRPRPCPGRRSASIFDAPLRPGDHLVFGPETRGLPDDLLDKYQDRTVTLPMIPDERSLNLATAVCAALAEGVRQLRDLGAVEIDVSGRLTSISRKHQNDSENQNHGV